MASLKQAKSPNQEGRIDLAIQAIKLGQIQSIRAVAEEFDVPDRNPGIEYASGHHETIVPLILASLLYTKKRLLSNISLI
jgi:hypothetical protein